MSSKLQAPRQINLRLLPLPSSSSIVGDIPTPPNHQHPISSLQRDYGVRLGDPINFSYYGIETMLRNAGIHSDTILIIKNNLPASENFNSLIETTTRFFWQNKFERARNNLPLWFNQIHEQEWMRIALLWQHGINDQVHKFQLFQSRDLIGPPLHKVRVTDYIINQLATGVSLNKIKKQLSNKKMTSYVKLLKITSIRKPHHVKSPLWKPYYTQFLLLGLSDPQIKSCLKMFHKDNIMSGSDFKMESKWGEIYWKVVMNPYAWYMIALKQADTLIKITGRQISDWSLERRLGELSREIYANMNDNKWTATPMDETRNKGLGDVLDRNTLHPMYKNNLQSNYGIMADRLHLYLLHAYHEELAIFRFIRTNNDTITSSNPVPLVIDAEQFGHNPTQEQQDITSHVLTRALTVVTGGAGTGKTTVIKLIALQLRHFKKHFQVVTFTGKAVDRIRDVLGPLAEDQMGESYVRTIHSLAKTVQNQHKHPSKKPPRKIEYIIIDEATMISLSLMAKLLRCFDREAPHFIIMGDVNQLPPVTYGRPFEDMIRSNCVQKYELTRNLRMRDGTDDPIIINANNIVTNPHFTAVRASNFRIGTGKPYQFIDQLIALQRITLENVGRWKFITPTKAAALRLNQYLSQKLNSGAVDFRTVRISSKDKRFPPIDLQFKVGDPIIFTKNGTYQKYPIRGEPISGTQPEKLPTKSDSANKVYNGTEARITQIDIQNDIHCIRAETVDHHYIMINLKPITHDSPIFEIHDVLLAYAITVHKAQGSEWSDIYFYLEGGASAKFLNKRMTYTSITRPKELCIVIEVRLNLFNECSRTEVAIHHGCLADRIIDFYSENGSMQPSITGATINHNINPSNQEGATAMITTIATATVLYRSCDSCQELNILLTEPLRKNLCKGCYSKQTATPSLCRKCRTCQRPNILLTEPEWKMECLGCYRRY